MSEIIIEQPLIHLRNEHISYCIHILPDGTMMHLYFGKRLESVHALPFLRRNEVRRDEAYAITDGALGHTPQEYPAFGMGDIRPGACTVRSSAGMESLVLRFVSAEVQEGKQALQGLPATFGSNCKTLRLVASDEFLNLKVIFLYTIFDDCDCVARSVCFENCGKAPLHLEKALSLCLDMPECQWELLTLSGSWAQERTPHRRSLVQGYQAVRAQSGSSSHQTSPFAALLRRETTENTGEVYGAALVYSGNFEATAFLDEFENTRLLLGIDSEHFSWKLEPGATFQTPEAVLVYSDRGLNHMSHQFHLLCSHHLSRGNWAHRPRPVLLNNWEGTYFDFTEEKLLEMGRVAADLGVELFVLDDGWFGKRDADNCSLGDWYVNTRKLPHGLDGLIARFGEMGLKFGLWMEPEMVSPDSDLYRAHPDWAIGIPGREPIYLRNQLVLDLSRPEVSDYVHDCVAGILKKYNISYIKWDMNRVFACIGSGYLPADRQRELPHRYMLGLYGILERIVTEFPDVLFEGCAGGGGRFDLGMLHYFPQIWCSDDTDPVCRAEIQEGTSYVFPMQTMGAHVSASPNHQTGRATTWETRFGVARLGAFGYELDVCALSEAEKEEIRRQISRVKATREALLEGRYYRLRTTAPSRYKAWMQVSTDGSTAVLTLLRISAQTHHQHQAIVWLQGLEEKQAYILEETGDRFSGSQLMYGGICMRLPAGDAACGSYTIRRI